MSLQEKKQCYYLKELYRIAVFICIQLSLSSSASSTRGMPNITLRPMKHTCYDVKKLAAPNTFTDLVQSKKQLGELSISAVTLEESVCNAFWLFLLRACYPAKVHKVLNLEKKRMKEKKQTWKHLYPFSALHGPYGQQNIKSCRMGYMSCFWFYWLLIIDFEFFFFLFCFLWMPCLNILCTTSTDFYWGIRKQLVCTLEKHVSSFCKDHNFILWEQPCKIFQKDCQFGTA